MRKKSAALPSGRTLRWVLDALGVEGRVANVAFLSGGTTSSIYAVRVYTPGQVETVVLRRWIDPSWEVKEAYLSPANEAKALDIVTGRNLRGPRLLAVDESGEEAGVPALLMSFTRGEMTNLDKVDHVGLRDLALRMAEVHDCRIDGSFPEFRWYNSGLEFSCPSNALSRETWERAFETAQSTPSDSSGDGFLHRDINPSNVLWEGGAVSAFVDWGSACRGARWTDLAHARWNWAVSVTPGAADALVQAYLEVTGLDAYPPIFDIRAVLDLLPEYPAQRFSVSECARLEAYLENRMSLQA